MDRFLLSICFVFAFMLFGYGQQEVFSRGEVTTGNWADGQLPWFYQSDNNSQGDPDNNNTVANLIRIGHNNNTTMTLNGRIYRAKEIIFQAAATSNRTIQGDLLDLRHQNGGPSKIENQSTGLHTFTNQVAILDGVTELNPINGNLSFTNSIFTNGNFIDVFGNNGHKLILSGNVQGAGGIALKQNSIVEIAANMTYTGGTAIEGGTFRILSGGNLSDDTNVTISSGATFDLNNQDVTVRSVSETGTSNGGVITLGSGTLTITGDYTGDRFQNTISGTGNLVKNGSGNWVLYGDNTFSGTTTINAGILRIDHPNGLGTLDGLVTVNNGAALELNAGANYPAQNLVISGTGIADGGALRKIDTGNRTFAGAITLNDNSRFTATGGTLQYDGNMNLNGNTMYFGGNQNFEFRSSSTLTNATKTTDDGAFFKDGTGILWVRPNLDFTGNLTLVSGEIRQYTGNFPSDGKVIIRGGTYRSDGTTDRTIPKGVDVEGDFTLGHIGGGSIIISGNVNLSGANRTITTINNSQINAEISNGSLTKLGEGTLSLGGANTFSGNTAIQEGILQLTSGGNLSDDTNVTISSGATFDLNNQDVTVRSVSETGTSNGGVITLGSGTLTINGGYIDNRFQNSISGSGNLVKNGTGSLSLYGSQSFTGTTTINGGTLATSVDLASNEVIVNASGTFSIPSNQEVTIQDLTLASGATVDLASGSILTVTGAFVDNGFTLTGIGELRIIRNTIADGNWTTPATWSNNLIPANTAYDIITVNHDVNLDTDLTLTGSLQIEVASNLNINSNVVLTNNGTINVDGSLVFGSTSATETAQYGESSGTITGNVTVERHIPAKRAFRFLSSAVSDQSIANSWQQAIHITGAQGSVGNTSSEGFDETASGAPSMFTFNTGSQNWSPIPNTNATNLEAGTAYRVLVRGDRASVDLNSNNSPISAVTLSATGTLATGSLTTGTDLPALATSTNQFSLVGNPYQAVVDASQLTFNGDIHTDEIAFWDPNMATNGNFVVVNITTTNGTPNPSSSAANKYIMPGQGFLVVNNETVTTAPSIVFNESAKATLQDQTAVFSAEAYLNLRLYTATAWNNNQAEQDAIGVRWSANYSSEITDEDFGKLTNPDENFALNNSSTLLSIDKRNFPENNEETIPLFVNGYTTNEYLIYSQFANLPEGAKLYIEDHYLETTTELENGEVYAFNVDASVPESMANTRFSIQFEVGTLSNTNFEANTMKIYPNPVEDELTLQFSAPISNASVQVEIFDLMGRSMFKKEVLTADSNLHQLNAASLSSGVYVVQVKVGTDTYTQRIIKM